MYYPTFFCSVTKVRHIVKDRYYCECGQKYNIEVTFKKKDLRKIKFKPLEEITCDQCKIAINKVQKLL